jgi:hypothetical protein
VPTPIQPMFSLSLLFCAFRMAGALSAAAAAEVFRKSRRGKRLGMMCSDLQGYTTIISS